MTRPVDAEADPHRDYDADTVFLALNRPPEV